MRTAKKTFFGNKEVDAEDKAPLVKGVFDSVAHRYDLMNDLMSAGLHRLWKDTMVGHIRPVEGMRVLDLAGGTGDIAFRIRKKCVQAGVRAKIIVSDINASMLEEGRARAIDRGITQGVDWQVQDAETLTFQSDSFEYVTIAFGIRNVTHIEKALAEAYRVLKPGGKFICMEFSPLENPLLSKWYDFYSFQVIPRVGKLVTGDQDSYRYLVESIRKFPDKERFKVMLEQAGFSSVQVESLAGGAVAIHTGWKI